MSRPSILGQFPDEQTDRHTVCHEDSSGNVVGGWVHKGRGAIFGELLEKHIIREAYFRGGCQQNNRVLVLRPAALFLFNFRENKIHIQWRVYFWRHVDDVIPTSLSRFKILCRQLPKRHSKKSLHRSWTLIIPLTSIIHPFYRAADKSPFIRFICQIVHHNVPGSKRRRGKSGFKDNGTIILELREFIPIPRLFKSITCDQSQHETSYILRPRASPAIVSYKLNTWIACIMF